MNTKNSQATNRKLYFQLKQEKTKYAGKFERRNIGEDCKCK